MDIGPTSHLQVLLAKDSTCEVMSCCYMMKPSRYGTSNQFWACMQKGPTGTHMKVELKFQKHSLPHSIASPNHTHIFCG